MGNERKTALHTKMYPSLRLKTKAASALIGEDLHDFIDTACRERLQRLHSEGVIPQLFLAD